MDSVQGNFGKLFDLRGRVALITGAGAGFGEVIAAGFAEYGCDIAAADLNLATAKQTAEKVAGRGRRSVAIRADVGSPAEIEAMVDTTVRELGTIDILVNSAGISQHQAAVELARGSLGSGRRYQSAWHFPVLPNCRTGHAAEAKRGDDQPLLDRGRRRHGSRE